VLTAQSIQMLGQNAHWATLANPAEPRKFQPLATLDAARHHAPVSKPAARRSEILFALGNLVPALLLGVGLYALPVRWWPADVVLGAAVVALPASSAVVFGRPGSSLAALRVGGSVLLAVGLALVGAALLSVAFLSGIHGDFGAGGVVLMSLIAFMVLPYVIVYPLFELWWLDRLGKTSTTEEPAPAPPVAPVTAGDDRGATA
jgi:hypothetical protein